jgi:hypothetical protein
VVLSITGEGACGNRPRLVGTGAVRRQPSGSGKTRRRQRLTTPEKRKVTLLVTALVSVIAVRILIARRLATVVVLQTRCDTYSRMQHGASGDAEPVCERGAGWSTGQCEADAPLWTT